MQPITVVLLFFFLVLALLPLACRAYPNSLNCGTPLTAGTRIMGYSAQQTSNAVQVMRGSTALSSGSSFNPGETLTIQFNGGGQYALEATGGATFSSGGACGGSRYLNSAPAQLTMPSTSTGTVTIKAGYAGGRSTVYITQNFMLIGGTGAPTKEPSKAPTAARTLVVYRIYLNLVGTLAATFNAGPSVAATFSAVTTTTLTNALHIVPPYIRVGNVSAAATSATTTGATVHLQATGAMVRFNVSLVLEQTSYATTTTLFAALTAALQSAAAVNALKAADAVTFGKLTAVVVSSQSTTGAVTVVATAAPTYPPTPLPSYAPMAASGAEEGLFIDKNAGIVSAVCVIGGCILLCGMSAIVPKTDSTLFFLVYGAAILGILSLGLVSGWAKSTPATEAAATGYLGVPDRSTNLIAWHAVLMVGGFYVSQLLAVLTWSMFPPRLRPMAAAIHAGGQTVALMLLILGLVAAVSYKTSANEPQLTTLHSWLGVLAVLLFCLAYGYGLITLAAPSGPPPESDRAGWVRAGHRALGGSALILVAVTAVTGVMNFLTRGGCSYVAPAGSLLPTYGSLPDGCKVGNGLAIVVALSLVAAVSVVIRRHQLLGAGSNAPGDTVSAYHEQPIADHAVWTEAAAAPSQLPTPSPWGAERSVLVALAVVATALAVLALALAAAWTRGDPSVAPSSLGAPDWTTNLLSWHALLMTGGFFFAQVVAIMSWTYLDAVSRAAGKVAHALWHTAALATMVAGLVSVVAYKQQLQEAQLTTAHSWVGALAVLMFCVAYLYGLAMAAMKAAGVDTGWSVVTG